MKIFVSNDSFKDNPGFKEPMARAGLCGTDESLSLGEIIIESDGRKFLVTTILGQEDPTIQVLV